MCKEIKVCEKHNVDYTLRKAGTRYRIECKLCELEKRKLRYLNRKSNEDYIIKKREIDRKYQERKRLENPAALKLAIEKYKQTDKYKELITYKKLKSKEGQFSHIYCIECNNIRVYGNKVCDRCKFIKKYSDTYNFISVCKHCNKEFGIETKLNNLGIVARFNEYCSIECNEQLKTINKKKNKKIYRRKRRRIHGKIEQDKEIANKYGIKYERINRTIVYRKHNYICTSCGVKCVHPHKDNYNQSNAGTLDHIIPKSKGGSHTYDNVTLLCRSCNVIKSDKILTDYKRNNNQMELNFTSYIPQGSQLQLQLQ